METRERCEGRYPVPQTSPPRDEPFDVTYRCQLPTGHEGQHGPASDAWPDHLTDDVVCKHGTAPDVHCCNCHSGFLFDVSSCVCITEQDSPPWREGSAVCTNCGESAEPHPAYADFVGPFCEGCWAKLLEYFGVEEDAWVRTAERDRARRDISLICDQLTSMQVAWKQQFNVLNGKAVDFDRGYGTGLIQAVTEVSGLLKSVKQAGR